MKRSTLSTSLPSHLSIYTHSLFVIFIFSPFSRCARASLLSAYSALHCHLQVMQNLSKCVIRVLEWEVYGGEQGPVLIECCIRECVYYAKLIISCNALSVFVSLMIHYIYLVMCTVYAFNPFSNMTAVLCSSS